ncbi:PEP-CTERM sorting domain-containing protein [Paludisphaera borealis]|uniref:Ice-binding protein C-terminal domain-containing protein n=1 Tax=Paludisphaera borealis TaxID=1387353 RepID=A0A1U7CPX3_9BACT|nr:PEP-CTERM sorting domain-containing protein [Paludisphaera borealis]APW60977.1 hypothetical protein BSF38_02474 [Paludisphaera borealis]MDR3617944.1 PEP-CTERM sorting domain-containing protein [Paludisphaera borealis]
MTLPFVRALGLAILAVSMSAGQARADLTFTLEEVGSDVVLSGSGSINTSVLTPYAQWFFNPTAILSPGEGRFTLGVGFDLGDRYIIYQGAVVFGPGVLQSASSYTGDALDLNGGDGFIGLPPGYVSGAPISLSMTFASQTLATLGATPGTYTWTLSPGGNNGGTITDTITLQVGAGAAVPEPSTLAMLSAGCLGLALRRWRRAFAFHSP